jgi:AcrR family transcriptional regulator
MSRKDSILQAATILFAEKGFKQASMSELCKMTGVAEGTIFYHFKNKEELFVAILEDLKRDIIDAFHRQAGQTEFKNGLEMLEGVITFYLQLAGKMEDRFLLLHRHDLYELAEVNAVCRTHLEEIYTYFLDLVEDAIERGQADGTIRKAHTKKMAWIVFSMVDGLVRCNTFRLYEAGALYSELMDSCRKMLQNTNETERAKG